MSSSIGVVAVLASLIILGTAIDSLGSTILDDVDPQVYRDEALQYESVGQVTGGIFGGSGVLISDRWVLTAGHVAMGKVGGTFTIGGLGYTIQASVTHPGYAFPNNFSDLGLLHLASPVTGVAPALQGDRQNNKNPLAMGVVAGRMAAMRRARWLAPWKDSAEKPALYHCISRVVDRRFVFGDEEREKFRVFMRMQENFSGCRVLSYCVMSNHFHLLLEVPPMAQGGISDEELLKRLSGIYTDAHVAGVAGELAEARKAGLDQRVEEIHARYSYRMHDLSEFMKTLLQRFTRWFNRTHQRSGTLWEERYKSVIVESGIAARTMAAYIDLNPVRAGMVKDPADYRWSSYGEAVGGGTKGSGKKARAGLVRACMSHQGAGFEAEKWMEVSRIYRRMMGLALGRKKGRSDVESRGAVAKSTMEMLESKDNETALPDLRMASMLRHRVRYFTDGAVIGSKAFVNEAFAAARERFTEKRSDGARRLRGSGKAGAGVLWSMRDLRVGIGQGQ